MNRQEAKHLLSAYRSNGADAHDPNLAEALQLARHDPELAAWFAAQQRFDEAVINKLHAATLPDGLHDLLYASFMERHRKGEHRLKGNRLQKIFEFLVSR